MDFFQNITSEASMLIFVFLIVSFLIGFLVARFSSLRKARELKHERDEALQNLENSKNEARNWQERSIVREADIKRQNIEIDRLNRQSGSLRRN